MCYSIMIGEKNGMKINQFTKVEEVKEKTKKRIRLMCNLNLEDVNRITSPIVMNRDYNYNQANLKAIDKMIEEEGQDRFSSFRMFLNKASSIKSDVCVTEESRKIVAKTLIR